MHGDDSCLFSMVYRFFPQHNPKRCLKTTEATHILAATLLADAALQDSTRAASDLADMALRHPHLHLHLHLRHIRIDTFLLREALAAR
jgi:hypothetical protein